jgi:hypothetical protein
MSLVMHLNHVVDLARKLLIPQLIFADLIANFLLTKGDAIGVGQRALLRGGARSLRRRAEPHLRAERSDCTLLSQAVQVLHETRITLHF